MPDEDRREKDSFVVGSFKDIEDPRTRTINSALQTWIVEGGCFGDRDGVGDCLDEYYPTIRVGQAMAVEKSCIDDNTSGREKSSTQPYPRANQ